MSWSAEADLWQGSRGFTNDYRDTHHDHAGAALALADALVCSVVKTHVGMIMSGDTAIGGPRRICLALPGVNEWFSHRGWVCVRIDLDPDSDEIAEIVRDAYRRVAPKRMLAQLGP